MLSFIIVLGIIAHGNFHIAYHVVHIIQLPCCAHYILRQTGGSYCHKNEM